MSDDWAKRDREAAACAIKDMNAARNFPDGTCPESRHVALIAETLAKGKKYHMLDSDREHCATSMAQTVQALWECRAKLAKAVAALGTALDEMVDYADTHPSWEQIWKAREDARTTLAELKGEK
jgi:hypothetical protein